MRSVHGWSGTLTICVGTLLAGCSDYAPRRNTPEPMLTPERAEEFGYEFQVMLMDARQSGRSRMLYASQDGLVHVYGHDAIDASSAGESLVFDITHDAGEQWSALAVFNGTSIAPTSTTSSSDKRSTRVFFPTEALKSVAQDGYLDIDFSVPNGRIERVEVPVAGIGPRVAIDGVRTIVVPTDPAKLTEFRDKHFHWTISNPQQQLITIALDQGDLAAAETPSRSPGEKNLNESIEKTVDFSKCGKDLEQAGEYRIVVRDMNAKIISTFPVGVRRGSDETGGWISAFCTIEDALSAEKDFGTTFAKSFYCVEVTINNRYDKPITVPAASLRLTIDFVSRLSAPEGSLPIDYLRRLEWARNSKEYLVEYMGSTYVVFNAPRTPMNFTAILSVFEFDKRHDPKQVFINILRGAGVIATAVPTFTPVGPSYLPIVNFINSPVATTLSEFLLADLVAHLAYLNANALHDSVTVPPHGSVAKYVFFPRGDIFGAWGLDLPMRIMSLRQERQVALEGVVQIEQQQAEVK